MHADLHLPDLSRPEARPGLPSPCMDLVWPDRRICGPPGLYLKDDEDTIEWEALSALHMDH